MAVLRSQFYQTGFALLVWLQKIERCVATMYDINLEEMNYLASSLSSQECYDFYNLLSHRRAIRGQIPIYAEKEKAQEISCISLLATWLTDPAESAFRSNENIELKLREIGRKDLARWVLGKINSILKRRQLDVDEINRQIEESEINDVIVRNRTGERIIPVTSMDDQAVVIKNENVPVDRQTSCIFWKVFFSCLIFLLLVTLFLCFYRFVYTKLRCICRSFDDAEDQECCLSEQTYGTTSSSDFPKNNSRKKNCHISNHKNNNNPRTNKGKEKLEMSENFSMTTETNDEIISSVVEEKRALLVNRAKNLTKDSATAWKKSLLSSSEKDESMKFSMKSEKSPVGLETSFFSLGKNTQKTTSYVIRLKNNFLPGRNVFLSDHENIENTQKVRRSMSVTRKINIGAKKINRSRSESFLSFTRQKNKKMAGKQKFGNYREVRKSKNSESPKWTSGSCTSMEKSPKTVPSGSNDETIDESSEEQKTFEKTTFSSRESLTGLSETYDELGMLFSQHFKRQSRPCQRKYCTLVRKLRRGKIFDHDVRKCRNRRKTIFGEKIIISWDKRPACSTGNICKDTYDEYEIMRATREEREILARSIIERRKYFLDQPCLSPVSTKSFEQFTSFDKN